VLRIVPEELELLEANAEFIRIGFLLPSGAYATVLLRELMKADTY
jgi:tRNA(Glu) U13 pseudouridine synthase TruD